MYHPSSCKKAPDIYATLLAEEESEQKMCFLRPSGSCMVAVHAAHLLFVDVGRY